MTEVSFNLHPKNLANLFSNLVAIGKQKAGEPAGSPVAMLRYNFDDETGVGQLAGVSCSRYCAGLDWVEVYGGEQGYAEVVVLLVNPEKTDLVDDLAKLATQVRGTGTAQDSRVHVTMRDGHSITVVSGEQVIGELGEADSGRRYGAVLDRVEDELDAVLSAPQKPTPTAFNIDLLGRLKDVKATGLPATWGMVDMFHHPELDVVAVAVGPTFRGLVGSIARGGYAAAAETNQAHLF